MPGLDAPFRFVHTADLHLDSPLKSLALRDEALARRVGGATRAALRRIVDLCIDEQVHALLIAGDLYDGEQTSMNTAAVLTAAMRRLDEAGIPVFMIRGNHDAASNITADLMLPDNVHVFDGRGGARTLADGAVAIHGVSFGKKHAPDSLLPKFKAPLPDVVNIGLLHTSLTGAASGGHNAYAPCTLGELVDHGFQYWALGHVHKREVHRDWPAVVMPGNPQGRDIGEDGSRSVSLVSIDRDGAHIETREVADTRFERVGVPLDGLDEASLLPDAMQAALVTAREAIGSDCLIVRLEFTGATPLDWRVRRDLDYLLGTAREIAAGLDGVWVEKIELRTTTATEARSGADSDAAGSDAVDGIAQLIDRDVLASKALIERLERDAAALIRKLPVDVRKRLGEDEAAHRATLLRLAREGSADVLAALRDGAADAER